MWGKAARTTNSAAIIGGVIGTGAFLGTGIAGATSTVLNDSATGSDSGSVGEQVAIKGAALQGYVKEAVTEVKQKDLFHQLDLGINADDAAKRVADISSIPLGTVANAQQTSVSGSSIAAATLKALKADGEGNKDLGSNSKYANESYAAISKKISGATGFTVNAANYVSPAQKAKQQQVKQQQEITKQQATIADNQTKIDEKLAAIGEDIRVGRIYVGRGK